MKKLILLLIFSIMFLSSCSFKMEMKNPFKESKNESFNFCKNNWKAVNF